MLKIYKKWVYNKDIFLLKAISRNSQPNCPASAFEKRLQYWINIKIVLKGTPAPPDQTSLTTFTPQVLDIQATQISKLYVCKGNGTIIERKENFIIFPISFFYGVTSDETCELIRLFFYYSSNINSLDL